MARDSQSKYVAIRTNDVLQDLVDAFETRWKQSKRVVTAGEITAVVNAITLILQA